MESQPSPQTQAPPQTPFPATVLQRMQRCGVIAVVVIDEAADIVPLAKALLACGIDVMELTLRTDAALEALQILSNAAPEMLAGVGTILFPDQVDQVVAAGAAFGVAPGLNPAVIRRAQQLGLPFAPGVVTPSEIETAIGLGCRVLKFFPAEPSGGIRYLRNIYAPYAHLGLQFIPLGGLNANNMGSYLYDAAVPAVGGSWIAPRGVIVERDWSTVIDNATEARRIVQESKNNAR